MLGQNGFPVFARGILPTALLTTPFTSSSGTWELSGDRFLPLAIQWVEARGFAATQPRAGRKSSSNRA